MSNNKESEYTLDIHLSSFKIPKNIIHDNDTVRVSITTLPDDTKQKFNIKGKKMNCANHVFCLNITGMTKKIVFVFRKKSVLSGNQMIASSTIKINDLINNTDDKSIFQPFKTEVKNVNLYYPLQLQIKEERDNNGYNGPIKRRVLGQMQIQFTFSDHFQLAYEMKLNEMQKKQRKLSRRKKNSDSAKINNGYSCSDNLL